MTLSLLPPLPTVQTPSTARSCRIRQHCAGSETGASVGAGVCSVISPARQASFQTGQIRFVRQYIWKIIRELLEGRNFAPSCRRESLDHPFALDAQFAGAPFKTLSQHLR